MPFIKGFLTIKETAEQLGVSTKTIRRRIQKGDLKAEMKDSVYGLQYFIKEEQVNTAQQIIEVVKVKKEYDVQELAITLSQYLKERDKGLESSIEKMAVEIGELKENNNRLQQEVLKAQEEHFKDLDKNLLELRQRMEQRKENQQNEDSKHKNIFQKIFKK